MQTHLRGRDMITTQEWTKDELDTVLDVAMDLKRTCVSSRLRSRFRKNGLRRSLVVRMRIRYDAKT